MFFDNLCERRRQKYPKGSFRHWHYNEDSVECSSMLCHGIFGGTFDPVHHGHVTLVQGVQQEVKFAKILIVPSHTPPAPPVRTPQAQFHHRIHMLKLAFQNEAYCVIDEREKKRKGPSYTVKILESVRKEVGEEVSLCFILGLDAFRGLTQWYKPEKIPELAHLIIVNRAGEFPISNEELAVFGESLPFAESAEALSQTPAGLVYLPHFTPTAVSATQVRTLLAKHQNRKELIPSKVWEYIQKNNLYKHTSA